MDHDRDGSCICSVFSCKCIADTNLMFNGCSKVQVITEKWVKVSQTKRFCKILCLFTYTCKASVPPCCGASPTGNHTNTWCTLVQMHILSEHLSWLDPFALGGGISRSSLEFYGVLDQHLQWLQGLPWGEVSEGMLWDCWNAGLVCHCLNFERFRRGKGLEFH